jgi:succinate dehydrogenase/fumarate reductase-like Fe-S protein
MNEQALLMLHKGLWWFHLLLAMMFIAIIPFTKLRHILTTSGNAFLADLGPVGKLVTIDLENEETENFGARHVADLSWKDIFDTDACTLCKRCQDSCPAYATDKPLSPMQLVNRIGETAALSRTPISSTRSAGRRSGPARPAGPARISARPRSNT